ncbi:hypothetical protein CONPUDRAFT_112842 [Coniophora puteana RWD-64-598 SS2]|uniref:Uncharacterized protein n=1 Tax=Coniophora puteana (strain RWD-64-598) TaxID=741705 RepID=A0A5M3M744_CONPW|nr:uncharacterized protein CONPUDRAFT_112842 [Coniophora puteana RWD-64-598 SS2]EIW74907.1 hypothetical protein CONPUDRAFT_112842 [Coniophora puteana RWD-64-598 SS2]
MAEPTPPPSRGRGRGKSRGGLGKYLRARGRGRGGGRPAEFRQRLVLDSEQALELDEEEQKEYEQELQRKYARRNMGTNADRYKEPEPELNSEGEEIVEPEVDLSEFLAKQRLVDANEPSGDVSTSHPRHGQEQDDDDDIDHNLAHISSAGAVSSAKPAKGKVQSMQWDPALDEMLKEKQAAEAARDLKTRFRARTDKLRSKPTPATSSHNARRKQGANDLVEAPPLPTDDAPPKGPKAEMEDFLDDLLG